jgi:hypothetical protein
LTYAIICMTTKRPCARVHMDGFMSGGAVQRVCGRSGFSSRRSKWYCALTALVLPNDEEKNEQDATGE